MTNINKYITPVNKVKYYKWKENISKLGSGGRVKNNTKVDEKAFLEMLNKM